MKVTLVVIGKTDKDYLKKGIDIYSKRLFHYLPFEIKTIPDIKSSKNLTTVQQKEKEGVLILNQVNVMDQLILLDEKGEELSSVDFSKWMEKRIVAGTKHLVFVIGGPYGFSPAVKERANGKLSLSKMTFSHQMARLIFIEQLYRAMSILNGEPYHHE
ncbi:23S rRNA (pseudouridine(1915)-N(3))-methyltransferase RlmH [Prolixibacter sp. SD074]|uniref:23S rRNA (pseudouridine(1915)-N(3))-methyltransferase RlmH n=1 Tax=Prolixibacter sp. SD074 TaxID=2652391 RepID=UPI001273D6D4|nr:23S rRNA (pseudouridine(1915)-N(3))-methyltransferase RlmH [Prolixibacter sp. SD074]GET30752.1 ribosomal RNA large subunit methyltransferase H [Prolixibacter sp. SD074]